LRERDGAREAPPAPIKIINAVALLLVPLLQESSLPRRGERGETEGPPGAGLFLVLHPTPGTPRNHRGFVYTRPDLPDPDRIVMRALFLWLACCMSASSAFAREVEVARLAAGTAETTLESVRAARPAAWVDADAIRLQGQPSWWRLQLAPGTDTSTDWVLAIKEAYDAELVAYLPPDYRAQPLSVFDPTRRQIGSRHRLSLQLSGADAAAPVYLHLLTGRQQPMRISAAPLADYVAEDLARVRFTSMILSALLLLGLVAAVYSVALRRWHLLLFGAWVLSAAMYVLVMSGEIVPLLDNPTLLRHAMRLLAVSINLGMVAVYIFIIQFLSIRDYYPRLARVMYVILVVTALLVALSIVDPRSPIANQIANIAVVALALLSLAAAAGRARAGSAQGWFFLVGWGCLTFAGMTRALYFLQYRGTPDWLELLHPVAQVIGALVLVLATARAARYAERELHVARSVARTDALTRLPNRTQLDHDLAELMQQAEDRDLPLSVMFLDLDHFKAINDRHGHAIGDRCLITVGNILRRHVRASDLIVRYGGEEFVLALEGAGRERGIAAAEGLRNAVQEGARSIDGRAVELTVSIGLTDHRPGDRVESLLARADAALYRAKREGRNRLVVDLLS
jgi:diguanylate cyclase (GGDEF)-like protein